MLTRRNHGFGLVSLAAMLPAMLFAAIVGCGGSEGYQPVAPIVESGSETTTPGEATTAGETKSGDGTGATEKKRLQIAFVTNQIADYWKIAKAGCIQAEKDFDVDVDVRMPAEATAVEQQRIVEDLLNSGINAIAISPLDADNQKGLINDIASKIPLITQDSDAPGTDRLMYIGMDNYEAGRMCGKLVKKALPDGGKIMLFIGRLEQDNSKQRRQGVIDELLDRSQDRTRYDKPVDAPVVGEKYTIIGTLTDGGKQDDCKRKAEDALNTYPEMNGMVGLFEYNPVAILEAVKQADKVGKVQVIGFDENKATLQAIRDGQCIGTVVQNPYEYGYQSVSILTKILREGKSAVPKETSVFIPARSITKDNVDNYEDDLNAKIGE